jgi:hypothetical protein
MAKESECPFCHARVASRGAAVATVAAVAIGVAAAAGCGDKTPPPNMPEGTPSLDAGGAPVPTATASGMPRGDKNPAPVYGGPPP